MKTQLIILTYSLMALPMIVQGESNNLHCVTDMRKVADYAKKDDVEIENTFWIPERFPAETFEQTIKQYKKDELSDKLRDDFRIFLMLFDPDIRKYSIVYTGVYVDGKRLILCQLTEPVPDKNKSKKHEFYSIWDKGKTIGTFIFDPKEKQIIYIVLTLH